ncbi:MAG: ABC transporter substrate-binding protein [Chloroflexota bacterium]|nr:MAG: ABC transporter substrate-binding protein [Chloroflexota bacterium]
MKAFGKLIIFFLLFSLIAGCTPKTTPVPPVVEPTQPPAEPTLTAKEAWVKENGLGEFASAAQDWAAIEAAAKLEGKVVVYANSSRIAKAADIWAEMYPEITLEGYDLGGDDVLLKTVEEQKSGAFVGDVWFSSGGPEIIGNLMPKEYLWRFVPDNLASVVPAELSQPLLTARFGVRILAYNSEVNPNGCPVSNLWELTNPEWKGKVFIEDPLNDASTLGILMTIAAHPDEMAAAYKELYGKDPELESDTPNAGWLWLKRFAQNGPIPEPGGDEVDSAFATPGMTDSYLAFTSYSNYPDVLEGNLAFEPCWDVKPVVGVKTQAYVGIMNQATHPNAAKLFIRFILNEGAEPWVQIGNYLPRTDVEVVEGARPFEELNGITWAFNDLYVYDNIVQTRDFYLLNLVEP